MLASGGSPDSRECKRVKAIALSSPAVRSRVADGESGYKARDLTVLWWMRLRVMKGRDRGSGRSEELA